MKESKSNSDLIKSIVEFIDSLSAQNELLFKKLENFPVSENQKMFLDNTIQTLNEIKNKLSFLKDKILTLDENLTHKLIEETGLIDELNNLNNTINSLLSTKIDRLIQIQLKNLPFSDN